MTLELEFIKEDGSDAGNGGRVFCDVTAGEEEAEEKRAELRALAVQKRLIARAGFVYVMPDGIKFSLFKEITSLEETFENITETGMTEPSTLGSHIAFEFTPSTSTGEEDVKIINSGSVTKTNTSRGKDDLVKIESGHSVPVNMYGITVLVREDGKTVEWVHNGVAETIAPSSGFYALTAHGASFSSLWGIKEGNYVEFDSDGSKFTVYESEALSAIAGEKPADPKNGKRWRDSVTGKLYQWSAAYNTWADISQDYIKVTAAVDIKADDSDKFFASATEIRKRIFRTMLFTNRFAVSLRGTPYALRVFRRSLIQALRFPQLFQADLSSRECWTKSLQKSYPRERR